MQPAAITATSTAANWKPVYVFNNQKQLIGQFNTILEVAKELTANRTTVAMAVAAGTLLAQKYYVSYDADFTPKPKKQSAVLSSSDMVRNRRTVYAFNAEEVKIGQYDTVTACATALGVTRQAVTNAVARASIVDQKYYFSYTEQFVRKDKAKEFNPVRKGLNKTRSGAPALKNGLIGIGQEWQAGGADEE